MIQKNKIISLAFIGLVLGGIIGAVVNSEQIDMYMLATGGGAIGFLAVRQVQPSRQHVADHRKTVRSDRDARLVGEGRWRAGSRTP